MIKKILFISLTAIVLLSCSNAAFLAENGSVMSDDVTSADLDFVKLRSAESSVTYGYLWYTEVTRTFSIEVANVAYDKEVFVHHTTPEGGWVTTQAQYAGPLTADGSIEEWTLELEQGIDASASESSAINFVVGYTVNGATYWDNNNSADYHLQSNDKTLGSAFKVMGLKPADTHYGLSKQYSVLVSNLAYDKVVTMVYTYNNWETTLTQTFNYTNSSASGDVEEWRGYIETPAGVTSVEYCFAYEAAGYSETFWDNSYGENYIDTF
jgi:hypothetical protein